LTEPCAFLDLLAAMEIELVCISAGSPYYNPQIQRPALFPPSDGYQPPEGPLVGVAQQIGVTASLEQHRPDLAFVGSAYSYTTYEIVKGTFPYVPFSTEPFETHQVFPKILDRPPVARRFAPANGTCYN
jgi:hypothetical protein